MGRPATKVLCRCEQCDGEFWRGPADITRGRGKFCHRDCYNVYRLGKPRPLANPNRVVEERICPVCTTIFLVGGRGRPTKRQQLCSNECQRKSRYRHGDLCKPLSPTDAAYLAGFLDGEGSIILYNNRGSVGLKVTFSNTHQATLQHIVDMTGVGAVLTKDRTPDKHKVAHWIVISSHAADSLLVQLQPYVFTKAAQLALALETMARLKVPALKADRSWHMDYRARMKALNARGPQQPIQLSLTG